MTLQEVVEEINQILPTLERYYPVESKEDPRNFKIFNVWYAVKKFEMVNGYAGTNPQCWIRAMEIPIARDCDIKVQQMYDSCEETDGSLDEEYDSFAHSYLVTLRVLREDFIARKNAEEKAIELGKPTDLFE
jgi:hypothetical protein